MGRLSVGSGGGSSRTGPSPVMIVMLLLGCVILLSQAGTTQAETWKCLTKDGQEVLTESRAGLSECQRHTASSRSPGDITFEKFRQISSGMTEGEVLRLAGEPADKYNLNCDLSITPVVSCPKVWVYYYEDKWVAELTFVSGRVTRINNYRGQ
jgi:hypothetical protein